MTTYMYMLPWNETFVFGLEQAALFDCLMPRLNFGVSAEASLFCNAAWRIDLFCSAWRYRNTIKLLLRYNEVILPHAVLGFSWLSVIHFFSRCHPMYPFMGQIGSMNIRVWPGGLVAPTKCSGRKFLCSLYPWYSMMILNPWWSVAEPRFCRSVASRGSEPKTSKSSTDAAAQQLSPAFSQVYPVRARALFQVHETWDILKFWHFATFHVFAWKNVVDQVGLTSVQEVAGHLNQKKTPIDEFHNSEPRQLRSSPRRNPQSLRLRQHSGSCHNSSPVVAASNRDTTCH